MILEVAILDVKPSLASEFETAFQKASIIIASKWMTINNYTAFNGGYLLESRIFLKGCVIISVSVLMPGYISHELQRCLETTNRYILLVRWQELEDHTVRFRQSSEYQEWRSLLHHFYDPFPTVEHYESVLSNLNKETL